MKKSFLSGLVASTIIINGPVLAMFASGKDEEVTVAPMRRSLDTPTLVEMDGPDITERALWAHLDLPDIRGLTNFFGEPGNRIISFIVEYGSNEYERSDFTTTAGAIRAAFRRNETLTVNPSQYSSFWDRAPRYFQITELEDSLRLIGDSNDLSGRREGRGFSAVQFGSCWINPADPMDIRGESGIFKATLLPLSHNNSLPRLSTSLLVPPQSTNGSIAAATSVSSGSAVRLGDLATATATTASPFPAPAPAPVASPSVFMAETPYRISQMPSRPSSLGSRDCYAYRCPQRNLWVQMERLTPEARAWWTKRLGFETHMQLSRELDLVNARNAAMSPEQRGQDLKMAQIWMQAMGSSAPADLMPSHLREAQPWIGYMYAEETAEETSARLSGRKTREVEEFEAVRAKFPPEFNDPIYSMPGMMMPIRGRKSVDYVCAWRGFNHNLVNANELSWVAYVSARPFERPLHASGVSVMSPDILMAMTVRIGDVYYSPLGIYGSPIAAAYAQERRELAPKNLSLFFHAGVAELVGQINPDRVQYMVVRPLVHMRKVLQQSGIPFSSTSGWGGDDRLPHIRYNDGRHYGGRSDEIFGRAPYIPYALVDPRTNSVHRISVDHWFTQHPFLGGSSARDDLDTMTQFPYMTTERTSLAAYLNCDEKKDEKRGAGDEQKRRFSPVRTAITAISPLSSRNLSSGAPVTKKEDRRRAVKKPSKPHQGNTRVGSASAIAAALADVEGVRSSSLSLFYLKGLFKRVGGIVTSKRGKNKKTLRQIEVRIHGSTRTFNASQKKPALKQNVRSFLQEL